MAKQFLESAFNLDSVRLHFDSVYAAKAKEKRQKVSMI